MDDIFSLQNISFRPSTVLTFMTGKLWKAGTNRQEKSMGKGIKKKELPVLRSCLPPECRVLYCVTNGIIGDFANVFLVFLNL